MDGKAAAVVTRNQAAALQMGQASGFNLQLTPPIPFLQAEGSLLFQF